MLKFPKRIPFLRRIIHGCTFQYIGSHQSEEEIRQESRESVGSAPWIYDGPFSLAQLTSSLSDFLSKNGKMTAQVADSTHSVRVSEGSTQENESR